MTATPITERANAHRGTFYAHFSDKYELASYHETLTEILVTWLKQSSKQRGPVPLETMAQLMSWTIFGAAVEWSQEPGRRTSEQMAHDVLLVITEGIAHLFPDAFSE